MFDREQVLAIKPPFDFMDRIAQQTTKAASAEAAQGDLAQSSGRLIKLGD